MRATHSGTCQLCGRLQKLPNGLMAKHGYTVQWGFFEGTCPGSDAQPFELSKDLIAERIEWAARRASSLHRDAEDAEEHRDMVWVHEHVPAKFHGGRRLSGYAFWRGIPREQVEIRTGYSTTVHWIGKDGEKRQDIVRETRVRHWEVTKVDEDRAVTLLNRAYATKLRGDAAKVGEYRDWLIERIKDWAPHPEKLVEEASEPKKALLHWYSKRWSGGKACASSAMGAQKGHATTNVSAVNCPKCIEIMKRKEVL